MNNKIIENIQEKPWPALIEKARTAYHRAYAPYSDFNVGAAGLTTGNTIVQGCNVENASYGLTVCAERNCIAQGVIQNENSAAVKFSAMVIYTEQVKLTPPCGACRQVISEFFQPTAIIMSVNHLNEHLQWTIAQLLPDAFTPAELLDKTQND